MAGYRIFHKPTYQKVKDTLAEIGITLSNSAATYTVTFSDNKYTSFYAPSTTGATVCDRWIFADDDSHTFVVLNDDGAPETSDVTPSSTTSAFGLQVFIAVKEDGTLYSNNGLDGSESIETHYFNNTLNMPDLNTSRVSNNDPALTELKLVPLAGNFYFANKSGTERPFEYYIFKHVYVNYRRWFPFGTIIRGANGETFMGWGWILFRLGANS